MKKGLRAIAVLSLLVIAGAIGRELYQPYAEYSGSQMVVIEPHMRAWTVAELLVERGVIAHRWPFLFRYWLGRVRHRMLKAGEYLFDRPLTPNEVYWKIVHGDVYLHTVTIPEGSDRFDIARLVGQQLGIAPEDFLGLTEQTEAIQDLDSEAPTLEGFLFPDTYRFPRGVTAPAVIAAMLGRFRRALGPGLPRQRRESPRTLHEVITLASLVEKETSDPAERPLIAGVFERRLKKRWPLQCDPTVIYAARLSHGQLENSTEPITRSELKFNSPYNTYRHAGLPPGPICNPGEASIRAALNPAPVDFFYFVSNSHGGHVFARTLAEHQRNVARYRRQTAALRRESGHAKDPASLTAPQGRGNASAATSSERRARKNK